jgi:hypothetical protein
LVVLDVVTLALLVYAVDSLSGLLVLRVLMMDAPNQLNQPQTNNQPLIYVLPLEQPHLSFLCPMPNR